MPVADRTNERPIGLSRRRDLVVVEQHFGGVRYWVVKDPLTLRFVRLRDEEYALFEALDGAPSLHDLVVLFESRFAPQRIRPDEVSRFVGVLHQSGLLVSTRSGQGPVLRQRGVARRRREFRAQWLNPLAVRFRGIDPTRLFDRVYPLVRPLFTRTAAVLSISLMLAAALLVAVQWRTFSARLPTFHEFFTPSNLMVLAVVTAGIKVLHEFGHGLTCRHFGGECHELGAMLLVFTPCLYCDVTDAWRFTNKWRRIAVGAAGIIVELNLAAAATFIWWFSEPGLVHQLALGVMTVASVGTLVFNGNPLMRYDGYYILADFVETPNLAERSASVLRHGFSRWCLGIDEETDPLLPARNRGWFAAYGVASGLYRWMITFSIILFLVAAARPYRLENLARLLGLLGLSALVLSPLMRFRRLLTVPGSWRRMKSKRVILSTVAGLAIVGFLAFVPVRHRIFGPLELQPFDAAPVYVEVAGRVVEAPQRYGDAVAAGTLLAVLENRDVDLAVEELTARRDRQRIELASLRREQFDSPSAAAAIPSSEKLLDSLESQLRDRERDRDRLTLAAARSGTLFPPADVPPPADDENLPAWTGRPLDEINRGCTVDVGLLVGRIGDPTQWEAAVVVDQEDVEFIRIGDEAEILLDALPGHTFRGRVEEIALGEMLDTPERLSNQAGGEVATTSQSADGRRPTSTAYQVRIRIDDPAGRLRVGWRGTARISVAPASLGARMLRSLSRTFHFNL